MIMNMKISKFFIVFVTILLVFHVNSQYYYNGTIQLLNSVDSLLWANDQYITYQTGKLYVTESIQKQAGEYEIYRSQLKPRSENIDYFYTIDTTEFIEQQHVTFFNRNNLPLCWLDSQDIENDKIQKVLINGQNIYLLQNKTKIRIHTIQDPQNQIQNGQIPDCQHQRYNWTNKDNQNYQHKEMISLSHRNQFVITYSGHIQVLYKNNQSQFAIVQTIDLTLNHSFTQNQNKLQKLKQSPYEVKYFVNQDDPQQDSIQQILVVSWNNQLWVYRRQLQQQKFIFIDNIRLNETILSFEIQTLVTAYVLVKDDCSIYKISLIDEKQQPYFIYSYNTLCAQSLLTPKIWVRESRDALLAAVERVQQGEMSYEQLTIHLTPIPEPRTNKLMLDDKTYKIPLRYKQTYFSLLAYHFDYYSDLLYILLRQQNEDKAQIFLAFQICKLQHQQMTELQWQWRSDKFYNGVKEYSIDQGGVFVLQYDPSTKIQDFTWYQSTIINSQYKFQQPLQISRLNTTIFYQNIDYQTITAYDFINQKEQYKFNLSKYFHSSPSGNFTIQIKQNELKKIEIYQRQKLIGSIQLENQFDPLNYQLQFMNDSIIIEIQKVQEQNELKFILIGYFFGIQQDKFDYKTLGPLQITLTSFSQIKINSYNIAYLKTQEGKIVLLEIGQDSFVVQQEFQLPQQIKNPQQLMLGLSEDGNIYTAEFEQNIIHEWIFCEQQEYFQNGECLHKPIGPDPNPLHLMPIICAIIGGLLIILVAVWQILKYRSTRRQSRDERNQLLQSFQRNQQNQI